MAIEECLKRVETPSTNINKHLSRAVKRHGKRKSILFQVMFIKCTLHVNNLYSLVFMSTTCMWSQYVVLGLFKINIMRVDFLRHIHQLLDFDAHDDST